MVKTTSESKTVMTIYKDDLTMIKLEVMMMTISKADQEQYLYDNNGNDVIFAGFYSDFLSGGDGNNELYGDFGVYA